MCKDLRWIDIVFFIFCIRQSFFSSVYKVWYVYKDGIQICGPDMYIKGRCNAEMKLERTVCFFWSFSVIFI